VPADPERIGVSPYLVPLSVLHVTGPERAAAEHLAGVHRVHGWDVAVARSAPRAPEHAVVVLHGLGIARLRARLRGSATTVVLAGADRPAGPVGLLVERLLAQWTNAVVVSGDAAAEWWAHRVPVPVTRLRPGAPDPDEIAAILVRAAAWGRPAAQRT